MERLHTQRKAIKAEFTSRPNTWIPLPEIMRHSAQYNARIFELRRQKMTIINKIQDIDGERHSWYLYRPDVED